MAVPGQAQVTYAYDNADRLTAITQGAATTGFAYDNANRRTGMTLSNGVVASYAYDNANQLTGITYKQGTTTVGTLTYAYDKAGRISSRGGTLFQSVLPAAVTSATYDIANRMTARTAAGATATPAWDLNGSLTSDGLRSYSWDARNRLTAVAGVASYSYDGLGRRQSSTLGANPKRSYLYDGFDVVQEQTAGAPSANVLTGAGTDERLTRTPVTGANAGVASTFLTDALGSTVALVNSAGAVQTTYGYDPYGNTSTTGTASDSPYQYAGRENDGTGLYYNRARYYNPSWGRFVSEDPIGLRGGINRYAYAGGNPVSFRDPSGKFLVAIPIIYAIVDGITIGVGGAAIINNLNSDPLGSPAPQSSPASDPAPAAGGSGDGGKTPPTPPTGPSGSGGSGNGGDGGDGSPNVPQNAKDAADYAAKNGDAPQPGYRGGGDFRNDGRGGGQNLPKLDGDRNPISYKEYDINPYQPGVNRGTELVVTGTDGSAYYTPDHYSTFTKFR